MKSIVAQHRYNGSILQKRNRALRLAARLSPATAADVRAARFVRLKHVTTVNELCANAERCGALIDGGREPHLLVPDELNDGYRPIAVYDFRPQIEQAAPLRSLDLHMGEALVRADTLVYWK